MALHVPISDGRHSWEQETVRTAPAHCVTARRARQAGEVACRAAGADVTRRHAPTRPARVPPARSRGHDFCEERDDESGTTDRQSVRWQDRGTAGVSRTEGRPVSGGPRDGRRQRDRGTAGVSGTEGRPVSAGPRDGRCQRDRGTAGAGRSRSQTSAARWFAIRRLSQMGSLPAYRQRNGPSRALSVRSRPWTARIE